MMGERMAKAPVPPQAARPPGEARQEPASRLIPLTDGAIDSCALFGGSRSIGIAHCGQVYRLRLTASDRILLTK